MCGSGTEFVLQIGRRDCPHLSPFHRSPRHRHGKPDAARLSGRLSGEIAADRAADRPARTVATDRERLPIVRRTCPARSPQAAHRNATGRGGRSGRARTRPARADAMAGGCGAFPAIMPAPCPADCPAGYAYVCVCYAYASRNAANGCRLSPVRRTCPADRTQAGTRARQIGNGCRLSGRPSGEIAADRAAYRERLRLSPVRQTVRRGVGTVATSGGFRRVVFSGIYKAQAIEKSGKTQTRRNGARRRRLSRPKRQNRP